MTHSSAFIQAENLNKLFGRFNVLRNINLSVDSNEFLAIMGRNGAGKTTLLRILSLLVKPNNGKLSIGGNDAHQDVNKVLKDIGVISHQVFLYGDLTAEENLNFYSKMYDVQNASERIQTLLDRVGLILRSREPIRRYSRGMQQRLSIARAILHSPRLLLLDEPYTGLDRNASAMLDQILRDYHQAGNCIIMVSHDIDQVLNLASRVILLDKGQIAFESFIDSTTTDKVNSILKQYLT
ncbi:heme ABC exporter ATP-binding protein CcmA [bacterium]|nr:heme ABC exporter ATP-binding protein CcmA [bacterium]